MRVLVIGGTLFIGRRLVEELQSAGHEVTILHRNGTAGLIADRNDPDAVRSALAGHRFDAVFDNVYDWQRGTTAEHVEATALACAHGGLQRYVFLSSVGAFPIGLDHLDGDALVPRDDPNSYARNKANSERALFAMGGLPAVTIRPPFVYGPRNPFYREAFFWDRLRDGRPILVPGDGSRLMQFSYVDDIVRCCLRILDTPASVGQAFNVGNRPAVTQLEAVTAFAGAAGVAPRIVFIPREAATRPKLYFGEYLDLPPITMRTGNMTNLLGVEATPFAEGLRLTYEWWREHDPFPQPDYSFEDELLRRFA